MTTVVGVAVLLVVAVGLPVVALWWSRRHAVRPQAPGPQDALWDIRGRYRLSHAELLGVRRAAVRGVRVEDERLRAATREYVQACLLSASTLDVFVSRRGVRLAAAVILLLVAVDIVALLASGEQRWQALPGLLVWVLYLVAFVVGLRHRRRRLEATLGANEERPAGP